MLTLLYGVTLSYCAVLLLMFLFQRSLMYAPEKNISSPAFYGLTAMQERRIAGPDGSIQLWESAARQGMPTIVYFHGNAGHIGDRAAILSALAERGFGVIAFNYPGYGASEGSPSERAIFESARAVMRYAAEKYPPSDTLLYGESLGSGVAVRMATEFAAAGLALQSPYTSVASRAAEIYFYLPARWLVRDRFDSIGRIGSVKMPLVIFHGERDRTIPVAHGRALFEKANEPKKAYYFPEVDHNDFDSAQIAAHMVEFARAHRRETQP